ncbi:RHS repeat-associated core domain-containing protein [Pseudomonas fulva]|uniref:RHS repeat-associated core domain-containing protein n=1 Tax=Pseudomonas fulva TaxID=47880 RepID=UPI0006723900|nr:RHS repeat-associated core domain-containing protein [Pseudomonas fulva]
MSTPPSARPAETAVAPIKDIPDEDIEDGANSVDLWLRQISDNRLTLANLKTTAEFIPIANNIMAAVDAVGDIIALTENDNPSLLDWVSLGINLIGMIPFPPTMAFARKSLRPALHLVRQQVKSNPKGAIGDALITVLTNHLNATILGELENFVRYAQAELSAILTKCGSSGKALMLSIAGGVDDFLRGQLKHRPASTNQSLSFFEELAKNATLPIEYAAVEMLNKLSKIIPPWIRQKGFECVAHLKKLANRVEGSFRDLANAGNAHSIAYLLTMVAQAAGRKRAHLSANVSPTGIKQAKGVSNQHELGAIGKQPGPRHDAKPAKNGTCPCTKNSITFARGSEQLIHTDFSLSGPFPISWTRNYRSSQSALDFGPLGARWISPYTVHFNVLEDTLTYQADDGRSHDYPLPKIGKFHHDLIEEVVIVRTGEKTLSLARGHEVEEQYEEVGDVFRLVGIRRRGGARVDLHYEHFNGGRHILSDLLTYQNDDLHQHIHTEIDHSGHIVSLWLMEDGLPSRQLSTYEYDSEGDLICAQDEHQRQWQYEYQHHLITRYTDRTGRAMNLEWLGDGPDAKAVHEWADDGSYEVRLEWDRNIRLTYVTDALGHETKHYYNILGYTYRVVHPEGNEEWFFRDDAMNVVQHVHRDGSIDRYAYDERSNLLQHTRPDGQSVHHAYDELNQRFKTRDAEGGLWKYDYDQRGNVIETLDPLENKTQYTYNSDNLLIAITDANGGEKKLSYTPDGQLASYTDCSGKTTQWRYDTFGQLTKLIDAAGEETEYHYEAGHLSSLVYPDKTRDRFEYDAEGRLLSYVDALHRRTTWTYNEAGLIQQRLNPDDSTLHYHWDKIGQLVRLRNENNSEASFKYDPVGRLVRETGFDKQITDYFYDNSSELPTRRLDGDRITHFEYDPMGRLVESSAGERGGKVWETETFAYDGNGRLLLAENQACKLQWFYDLAGNNTREHQHFKYMQQPKVAVFTHEYDALNLRIATTRPDGHRVSWLTYGSGHLLGLKFDDRELLNYQRDDLHREIGREQGNGLVQRQTWTPNGQLLEQTLAHHGATKRIAMRSYRYDEAGQLTHINDLNRGDLRYRYDPVGRLLEAGLNYDKELFAFDPASNLLDPQAPPGPNPHSPRKIRDNILRSYCGTQYRYDERGNLLERIENGKAGHFTWDLYNRLRRYEDDRLIVDFAYDALGRRLYKNSRSKYRDRPQAGPIWNENARRQRDEELGCGFTWFTWEGDTLATECRDQEERGGSTTHYVFEPETFVPVAQAVINSTLDLLPQPTYGDHYDIDRDPVWLHKPNPTLVGTFAWYQCDQLGTPMEMTDEDGNIAWSGTYKAWGFTDEKRSNNTELLKIDNAIRFQGQYFDVETGLHYNRYRYYGPEAGRFTAKDPIGFIGGLNTYSYGANPLSWVDPLGLAGNKANRRAGAILQNIDSKGGGHANSRHGAGTTLSQQEHRAITGIPPDCPCIKNPKPTDSTRFLSNIDQLDAIQRGNAQMNTNGSNSAILNMNRIIGEGYRAGGGSRQETATAVIVRRNNNILTAYPKLP